MSVPRRKPRATPVAPERHLKLVRTARRPKAKARAWPDKRLIPLLEAGVAFGLLAVGCFFTYRYILHQRANQRATSPSRPSIVIPNLIEAESLRVVKKSRDFTWTKQSTAPFADGQWTNHSHMFATNTQLNDWIELEIPAPKEGKYRVYGYFTLSVDYGTLGIWLNGQKPDFNVDLYSGGFTVKSSGPFLLGTFRLKAGMNPLKLEIVGRNPSNTAPHYQFGLDGFSLEPAK